MNSTKAWYLSRTVWAGLIACIAAISALFGFSFSEANQTELTEILLQLASAIAGLIAVLGRIWAKSRISIRSIP